MAYSPAKPYGFLDWGEDDGSVLISASLTSAADIAGATQVGAPDFNANGVLCGKTGALNWSAALTAAQKTALAHGFTMTCWVESGLFSDSYSGGSVIADNEFILNCFDTSNWGIYKPSGSPLLRGTANAVTASEATKQTGKGQYTRVDMSYSGDGKTTWYLDGLPVCTIASGPPTATPFATFIGVGGSPGGHGTQVHRAKNFMLRTNPVKFGVHPTLRHLACFGHSFMNNGDYGNANAAIVGDTGNVYQGDCRTLATIHRILHQHGIGIPFNHIRNYGVDGTFITGGANDFPAQIVIGTANGQYLKVAITQFGTNEVTASGAQSLATTYPTLQANYQTQISSLIAAGCDLILIGNTLSTANDSTYGTASGSWTTYKQRCDDMNAIHAAIVAANSQCVLVDLFTLFNGHAINSTDFTAGDRHPSDQGYNKIGVAFANALLANL